MPERFRGEILTMERYTNPASFFNCQPMVGQIPAVSSLVAARPLLLQSRHSAVRQTANLQFVIVNGAVLVCIEQVKCLVHLLFLLLGQLSSFPPTSFPAHRYNKLGTY